MTFAHSEQGASQKEKFNVGMQLEASQWEPLSRVDHPGWCLWLLCDKEDLSSSSTLCCALKSTYLGEVLEIQILCPPEQQLGWSLTWESEAFLSNKHQSPWPQEN